ncbi:unnamed protein product, partial [Medioppia subpectinata]
MYASFEAFAHWLSRIALTLWPKRALNSIGFECNDYSFGGLRRFESSLTHYLCRKYSQTMSSEELDEFFDANDHFIHTTDNATHNPQTLRSVADETTTADHKTDRETTPASDGTDGSDGTAKPKPDNAVDNEMESNRLEVMIVNEDDIRINADD